MKKSVCVALVLLFPTVAMAQKKDVVPSSITFAIPGLNCNTAAGTGVFKVSSWSWGASNPIQIDVTGGGLGAGKVSLQDLHVTKAFDGCSPALLGLVTLGTFAKMAVLTQQGADVTKTTTVELRDVYVTSWQVGSTSAEEAPAEQLSVAFRRICISDSASGTSQCYDAATNSAP